MKNLVDKYLGEAVTTDYKKVQGNDWIIYDEGSGKIQKVVKAGKNIDPKKHFVSSKSAAVVAHTAATKMAYLFLKKNKGFSTLVKTMALGAETDLVPADGGAKFKKRG